MLAINQVSKSFKDNPVLERVSLTAELGQLLHISGDNGSGKSTLFKIITGLLAADSGSVSIGDNDIIGALIENPGFLEYETAMTNLKFLANLNKRFDAARVTELMTQFDLNPQNRQSVAKYSVGMRQKLGIIQAVMENQDIILLDEPTRGLDEESISQFIVLLNSLKAANKMVIVASHDHVDGLNYDQSWVLKAGILEHE